MKRKYPTISAVIPTMDRYEVLKHGLEFGRNDLLMDFDMLYLDVGCGNRKRGNIGIDLRPLKSVDVVADMHHLPFRSNSFDGCFAYEVFEHADNPALVVGEINRVLKINSWLKIRIPRDSRMRFDAVLHIATFNLKELHNQYAFLKSGVHKWQISSRQLKNMLWANGFSTACLTFLQLRRENRKTKEMGQNFLSVIFDYCRSIYALAFKTADIKHKRN